MGARDDALTEGGAKGEETRWSSAPAMRRPEQVARRSGKRRTDGKNQVPKEAQRILNDLCGGVKIGKGGDAGESKRFGSSSWIKR